MSKRKATGLFKHIVRLQQNHWVEEQFVHWGKPGSATYSKNTPSAKRVVEAATPMMLQALQRLPIKQRYNIADYGSADGGNTMSLIRACIGYLQSRFPDAEVNVIYNDISSNDFNSLFKLVTGNIDGCYSYLQEFSNVHVLANASTFYKKCLPSSTVDLGFCSTAVHWLSHRPCVIPDALFIGISKDEESKQRFAEVAAQDWEDFLCARAAELKPEGQLVVASNARKSDDYFVGHTDNIPIKLFYVLHQLWQDMACKGIITKEECDMCVMDFYFRSEEEIAAPFKDENSPVRKAGLCLVKMETKVVRCVFHENWLKNQLKGYTNLEVAQLHAKHYVPSVRAWSNHTFHSALSDSRTAEEKMDILDQFYQSYENEVAKAPELHGLDFVTTLIWIEKAINSL